MMFGRKQRKIQVSEGKLEALQAALRQQKGDSIEPDMPEPAIAAPRLPHLSDAEFLTLCMEGTADQLGQESRAHLAQCTECTAEWERLQALGAVWQDNEAAARLEGRRRAVLRSVDPDFMPTVGRRSFSLSALIPAQAAYAAQALPDSETVTFSVYADGIPISDLIASVRRRDHEFHALITPQNAEADALYRERSVLLTISDEKSRNTILRREIAVGVAVLLGTHLPLTTASVIQAELTPPYKR